MFSSNLFSKKFKLSFIIAGAQKSGTTALYSYLRTHPDIALPSIKELHFFDNEDYFTKKKPKYSWIKKQFSKSKSPKLYGEATPIYMYWKPCVERIQAYNPDIKIICILRNPVHRAFSHWNHELDLENESRDFMECVKEEEKLLIDNSNYQNRVKSYLSRGLYSNQILELRKYFSNEQLLFIKYEDFLQNQEKIVNQILWFIGVSPKLKMFNENFDHNIKVYNREIKDEEKLFLKNIFENDVEVVEKLLNWDCSDWNKL